MRGCVGFTFMSRAERDGSVLFEGSAGPLISETHTNAVKGSCLRFKAVRLSATTVDSIQLLFRGKSV